METEIHTIDEAKELCGKCKREKVEGKCPACGRPPEYTTDEEMINKINAYIETCVDYIDPLTDKLKVNLPKREGLAKFIGVNPNTITAWEKEHKEFSRALESLDAYQKERLFDEGLAGNYNPTIAKLILSANHGMAEKQDIDQKVTGSVSLSNILDNANKNTK